MSTVELGIGDIGVNGKIKTVPSMNWRGVKRSDGIKVL
jgi:hypothetical protein